MKELDNNPLSPSTVRVLLSAATVIDRSKLPCPTFVSMAYWNGPVLQSTPQRLEALIESASELRERLFASEFGTFEVRVEDSRLAPKCEARFMALLKPSKRHGATLTISEVRVLAPFGPPPPEYPLVEGGMSWDTMMQFLADDDPDFFSKCDDV